MKDQLKVLMIALVQQKKNSINLNKANKIQNFVSDYITMVMAVTCL